VEGRGPERKAGRRAAEKKKKQEEETVGGFSFPTRATWAWRTHGLYPSPIMA